MYDATGHLDGFVSFELPPGGCLLLALGDSAAEAGVTELARRLGLHKSTASRLLAEGVADAISFGRPFIANPDLVARIAGHLGRPVEVGRITT